MAATMEHAEELAHARRLLVEDRHSDAVVIIDRFLRDESSDRDRLEALTLRLIGLINLGRDAECTPALDEAFAASRAAGESARGAELHALAALVAHRFGSLERCATHLVRSARALAAIELTDAGTAWAWHDLAMAYSYTGYHDHALAAIDHARQVAASVGLRTTDFAAPSIRLRKAVSLDQRGDTDRCQRLLRNVVKDLQHRQDAGDLDAIRPSSRGGYGYALARLASLGRGDALPDIDPLSLMDSAGDSSRSRDLRTLGMVCLAIAGRRPVEAVARLETAKVADETLGAAEIHRLRALAHLAAGDPASAYHADRRAFQVTEAKLERLRALFVEGVAARLDREELRRSVAGYADEQHIDQLTGLPGREQLQQYITAMMARGEAAVLGLCDLDRFTTVNSKHGLVSGDLVLQRVAGVLNRVLRRGDYVARYGGDEFMVVLPASARAEAPEIGRRIVAAVAGEDWDDLVPGIRIGVTIAWAGTGDDGPFASVGEALAAAEQALERHRAQRRAS